MINFHRNICIGQTKGYRTGSSSVWVTINYHNGRLSMTGVIGPHSNGRRDGGCGQIGMPTLSSYNKGWEQWNVEFLWDMWDRWHLNDMHPGCQHQMDLGWHKKKLDPTKEIGWHVDIRSANLRQWERHTLDNWRGLMGRPCPICGYRYGSQWMKERVPHSVLEWLYGLPSTPSYPWGK